MRTSKISKGLAALAFILASASAVPAMAQDEEESEISVSANVALTTDYRFRGIGLSGGDIAVQGGVDVGHSSGFYIGTWASSLEGKINPYGGTELDIYGGWSGDVGGVTLDIGGLYYIYPNGVKGLDLDYFELYGSISGDMGPVSAELGVAYAPDQDSLGSTDNFYIYTDLGVGIPDTPISVSGHLGYTDGFLTLTGNGKAWDYSIGADYAITDNLSFGVAYVGVEGPSIDGLSDDTVVATLSASF
ncbi:MAG: TorF family putative porin [Blastomonas sp.]